VCGHDAVIDKYKEEVRMPINGLLINLSDDEKLATETVVLMEMVR